jgi:RNA polymerase sigma factor (sigma-70 family)
MSGEQAGEPTQCGNGVSSDAPDVPKLTERLFREESGKLVSMLTGIFGVSRLQLAEDVVQEAMVRALQTWPYTGVPDNPSGWLMRTAKNRALDVMRREKLFHDKQAEIIATLEQWPDAHEPGAFSDELHDDRLRLIFACCHPLVPPDAQTAIALRTLCGFSPGEIASAFLTSEAAIAKRLVRARRKIADLGIPFEIPAGNELKERLDGVLRVIYFLFNEGYSASRGESIVREDLCDEAIRLASHMAGHPAVAVPKLHALLALMFLHGARLAAREDSEGNILRLKEQDRSVWNRGMIHQGLLYLSLAAEGDELSEYHLQAGIAACHCTADSDEATDWRRILGYYDQWMKIAPSPVVALNRAVAVARVHGPVEGIHSLEAVIEKGELDSYYLLHAVMGDLEERLHHPKSAERHFEKALQLTEVKSERVFLEKRLMDCRTGVRLPT